MKNILILGHGGIGTALASELAARYPHADIRHLGRRSEPGFDLLNEASIATLAATLKADGFAPDLAFDATGWLHGDGFMPERSWRELNAEHMTKSYALNAIGPALLMKHLLPLLPREGRPVFATLSARVGSISDNQLGGWHSYRAAKAALNQLVRNAAIELKRKNKAAICVALHPGTVATDLSEPFAKRGLDVREPEIAASEIADVLDGLTPEHTGGLYDHKGKRIAF